MQESINQKYINFFLTVEKIKDILSKINKKNYNMQEEFISMRECNQ